MTKHNDGGPAFPGAYRVYPKDGPREGEIIAEGGMSLRAYFAAKALPHCLSQELANRERYSDTFSDHVPNAVREARRIADYMIEELDKSKRAPNDVGDVLRNLQAV